MCSPMAIMGVASAGAQGMAAQRQAQNQASYNRQLSIWRAERYQQMVDYQQELADWQADNYYKTAFSAEESAQGQYSTVLERVDQVREQTLHNIAKASRAAQRGSAFVLASASETGTQGVSVALAQQQYELLEARHTYVSFENLRNGLKQSQRNLLGIQAQAQGRINAAMPAPLAPLDPVQPTMQVQSPSMLPYFVQGGSAAVGAAAWQQGVDAQTMSPADYDANWGGSSFENLWNWTGGGANE